MTKKELITEYGGRSYGVIGEVSNIKDTSTGEFLKVGDIVFYDTELPLKISGISFIVKNNDKESDAEPDFFVMGMKLLGGVERFKHIIKTSKDLRYVDFKEDFGYSVYARDIYFIRNVEIDLEEYHVCMYFEGEDFTHENIKEAQLSFLRNRENIEVNSKLVKMFRELNTEEYNSYSDEEILLKIINDIKNDEYLYKVERCY